MKERRQHLFARSLSCAALSQGCGCCCCCCCCCCLLSAVLWTAVPRQTFRPPSWRVRPCWYHRVHTTRDESRLAPWLCHPSRAKLCVCRTQPGRLRACHGAPCVQPAVHGGVVGNACPVYTAVSCSVMGQYSLHYGVPRCCYRFFLCKTTPPGPNGEPLFYCVEITQFLAQCTHFSTRCAAETMLVATSLNAVRCAAGK